MQIQIPPDLQPFVEQEFATGRYVTREQILVQALCWLRNEREQTTVGIQEGLRDAAAGRMQPLADAFENIRKEFGVPQAE